MTIYFTTQVQCEKCTAVEGHNSNKPSARTARSKAREAGWKRRDGKDLCGKCAAQLSLEIADVISRVKSGQA